MEFGVLDLVDWYPEVMTREQRFQQGVETAIAAEELGFDTFWLGEHHFSRYISSHPAVLLSAVAARTSRIRIGTSVVLAAHHDPVRLAEDYAMVDVISGGRLDLVVGRGAFLEGYRGYGIPYTEVRPRVEEALAILRLLFTEDGASFAGTYRSFDDLVLEPRPIQQPIPTWVAGGRSAETPRFAAAHGYHLALPQLRGPADGYRPAAEAYREGLAAHGRAPAAFRVSAGQHCWVAATTAGAEASFAEAYMRYQRMVGAEMRADLYAGTELEQPATFARAAADVPYEKLVRRAARVGSPDDVAARILETHEALRLDHTWSAFNIGGHQTGPLLECMTLFAREVIPRVRAALGG